MRLPFRRATEPQARSDGTTDVVLVDEHGRTIANRALDMHALQVSAEVDAGGNGDPVRILAERVLAQLGDDGERVVGQARHEFDATISAAIMKGQWPQTLTLRTGKHAARSAGVANGGSQLRQHGARKGESDGDREHRDEPRRADSRAPARASSPLPPDLFEQQLQFPSDRARQVYDSLVGLDEIKTRLGKEALLLTQPCWLEEWARKHHKHRTPRAVDVVRQGAPLLVFAGDVGTGKTALAESFGDAIARELKEPVTLLRMSIKARGNGIVGDMTQRISQAFQASEAHAKTSGHVTILLLDEADALAESRETQQMHHEDRAGVNALIQGVDRLRGSGVPIIVVFCTNRLDNIDPAVRRRAMDIVEFRRPDDAQRRLHLNQLLGDLSFTDVEMRRLVELTGARNSRAYGFTYSDISDRLVRNAVMTAIPTQPLTFKIVERVAEEMAPTRPFENGS